MDPQYIKEKKRILKYLYAIRKGRKTFDEDELRMVSGLSSDEELIYVLWCLAKENTIMRLKFDETVEPVRLINELANVQMSDYGEMYYIRKTPHLFIVHGMISIFDKIADFLDFINPTR